MNGMFEWCAVFNQQLNKWNISKVENMSFMFAGCESFNQDISKWDVSKVEHNNDMFEDCSIKEKYKPKFK
jgi:surface protein